MTPLAIPTSPSAVIFRREFFRHAQTRRIKHLCLGTAAAWLGLIVCLGL